jgi:hypothetical protein
MDQEGQALLSQYPDEAALSRAEQNDPALSAKLDAVDPQTGLSQRVTYQVALQGQQARSFGTLGRMYGAVPDPTKVLGDAATLGVPGLSPGSATAPSPATAAPTMPAPTPQVHLNAPAPMGAPLPGGTNSNGAPRKRVPDQDAYNQLRAMGMSPSAIAAQYDLAPGITPTGP